MLAVLVPLRFGIVLLGLKRFGSTLRVCDFRLEAIFLENCDFRLGTIFLENSSVTLLQD